MLAVRFEVEFGVKFGVIRREVAGFVVAILGFAGMAHGAGDCRDLFAPTEETTQKAAQETNRLMNAIAKYSSAEEFTLLSLSRIDRMKPQEDRISREVLMPSLWAYARYAVTQDSAGLQNMLASFKSAPSATSLSAAERAAAVRPRAMTGSERRQMMETGSFDHIEPTVRPLSEQQKRREFIDGVIRTMKIEAEKAEKAADPGLAAYKKILKARGTSLLTVEAVERVKYAPLEFAVAYADVHSLYANYGSSGRALAKMISARFPVRRANHEYADFFQELAVFARESLKTPAEQRELDEFIMIQLRDVIAPQLGLP